MWADWKGEMMAAMMAAVWELLTAVQRVEKLELCWAVNLAGWRDATKAAQKAGVLVVQMVEQMAG